MNNDMTTNELLELFKYYKEEKECPFEQNSISELWWNGEKSLHEKVKNDDTYFQRIIDKLNQFIKDGLCVGKLIDKSISINKRAIILYLDLWHGRNYPYDDLDLINKY